VKATKMPKTVGENDHRQGNDNRWQDEQPPLPRLIEPRPRRAGRERRRLPERACCLVRHPVPSSLAPVRQRRAVARTILSPTSPAATTPFAPTRGPRENRDPGPDTDDP
jgi:hypothetical protein